MDYISRSALCITANLVVSSWAYLLSIHSCLLDFLLTGFLESWLTLSWAYTYMSRKLHTCPVTPQEMGMVWNFTRATPLLHQVCAKHPTSHIATVQQVLNIPGPSTNNTASTTTLQHYINKQKYSSGVWWVGKSTQYTGTLADAGSDWQAWH